MLFTACIAVKQLNWKHERVSNYSQLLCCLQVQESLQFLHAQNNKSSLPSTVNTVQHAICFHQGSFLKSLQARIDLPKFIPSYFH